MKRFSCLLLFLVFVSCFFSVSAHAATSPGDYPLQEHFPAGKVGVTYYSVRDVFTRIGVPDSWALSSGSLPPGLTLDTSSGRYARVTGTPTKSGSYNFGLTASFSDGSSTTRDNFSIEIEPTNPVINGSFGGGKVNDVYLGSVSVADSIAPYTWEYTGTLPAGLTLSGTTTDTLTLSGTPSSGGTYEFTLTVTDGDDNTASRTFSVVIMGQSEPEPEPEPEPKPDDQTNTNTDTNTDTGTDNNTDTGTNNNTDTGTGTDTNTGDTGGGGGGGCNSGITLLGLLSAAVILKKSA